MSAHQPPPPFGQPHSPYPMSKPTGIPEGMAPLATAGQRFLARLLDTLILGVIWTLALASTGALQSAMDDPDSPDIGKSILSAIVTFIVYFVYEGAMLARDGQTLGKKAAGIRVAMLADGDVPRGRGWTRAAVYALPGVAQPIGVGMLFWLLNSLWQSWDKPFRQCLHDKVAKTVVVEAR
ncbi:RDD family protein [Streptomyces zagrosensis]|uniref:Putative RDD family membrane protein YckC n=1 Tax=Streptomyces zagrosensis TaxID=1042984 RepID=A0A7W9Q8B1_9ACTN|nr:RDD family protein [Streptomyces zagrosensis]MBB5935214.1 putative RDD family membrane protein YckC [Streptomyces zagrosensis]